jgi:hypothetical protein
MLSGMQTNAKAEGLLASSVWSYKPQLFWFENGDSISVAAQQGSLR